MALDQPNRKFWTYVDGNGMSWNKMGKIDAGCNAVDGSAAAVAGQPDYPRATRRRQPRRAIFQDPTTFRTAQCIIYTEAAFSALSGTSTLAVPVQSQTGTVAYDLIQKVPDKSPIRATSRNLPDHA